MNHHVFSFAQKGDSLLLPKIWNGDLIQPLRIFQLLAQCRHALNIDDVIGE